MSLLTLPGSQTELPAELIAVLSVALKVPNLAYQVSAGVSLDQLSQLSVAVVQSELSPVQASAVPKEVSNGKSTNEEAFVVKIRVV